MHGICFCRTFYTDSRCNRLQQYLMRRSKKHARQVPFVNISHNKSYFALPEFVDKTPFPRHIRLPYTTQVPSDVQQHVARPTDTSGKLNSSASLSTSRSPAPATSSTQTLFASTTDADMTGATTPLLSEQKRGEEAHTIATEPSKSIPEQPESWQSIDEDFLKVYYATLMVASVLIFLCIAAITGRSYH